MPVTTVVHPCRTIARLLAAIMLAALAACAGVQAPVEPFPPAMPDATTRADLLEARHRRLETLRANLDVTAQSFLFGKRQAQVLLLYQDQPRSLALKASQKNLMGSFLRVTVANDRALVITEAPEPRAYTGEPDMLRGEGGLVLGLMPDDLARVLLAGQTAVRLVREAESEGRLPLPRKLFGRHWQLEASEPEAETHQVLTIRREDGLVRRLDIYNEGETRGPRIQRGRILRADYEAFDYFDGVLLPSRFVIEAGRRKVHLLVETAEDGYRPNLPLTPKAFPIDPPSGLVARPLDMLFLELPEEMRY